eukprot:TCALIF_03723-PA protein Name:"Protein of unknown function" AED:0.99 eAED:1.00 QI:0/0/0/0.33/0.5/0.33/3/0/107
MFLHAHPFQLCLVNCLCRFIIMGAKDKHKRGQSRNNMNFKVVGGKAGKTKGRPQPVDIKLKKLVQGRNKKTDEVANLDEQFKEMQQKAVSMQKKPVARTRIEPSAKM